MKPFYYKWIGGALLICMSWLQSQAQADTLCNPNEARKIFGELYFNYGSVTNSYSQFNRATYVVGQPLASRQAMLSQDNQSGFGVYSPWFLPPQPPILVATQGDFKDRIRLSWNVNPLSPAPTGFVVYRDGSYLTDLGEDVRQFLDFNTQAGEFYEYSIIATNIFGQGSPSKAVGFVNPNGVISGVVQTNSTNPVPGVTVRLTPLTGKSMFFHGDNDQVCASFNNAFPTDSFTVSSYVKLDGTVADGAGVIDWGSTIQSNWWITAVNDGEDKGFDFHIGNGASAHVIRYIFPIDINPFNGTQWHQITMTFTGSMMTVYVDGVFISTTSANISRVKNRLSVGSLVGNSGYFRGNVDDLRIYNRVLTQSEIMDTKNRTVASSEAGLVMYWKFDEGIGEKIFDISASKIHGVLYGFNATGLLGPTFSNDIPEVYNAGVSDISGFYIIDGVNYSEVEQFHVTPMKDFYYNTGLEFASFKSSCASLTDYALPSKSTIDFSFYPFDLQSRQVLLSKGSKVQIFLETGKLMLLLNGTAVDMGMISSKYHTLSIGMDNDAGTATIYVDGDLNTKQEVSYTPIGNWLGEDWVLGSTACPTGTDYFTGLVDEFTVFEGLLPLQYVQQNYVVGTPVTAYNELKFVPNVDNSSITDTIYFYYPIFSRFDLNEGSGTEIVDYAALNDTTINEFRRGSVTNTSWTSNVRLSEDVPHEFEPNVRVANLNTSNTAIGSIDFKDVSTVNVSGYVRFANTFCFEDKVEILVNSASHFPPIYTDKDGKWSAEFEPGKTIKLKAVYKDHLFSPSFFEIRKLQSPRAGIVFLDNTKRIIRGQIAGGICRLSVIPDGGRVVVKVATLDGCFEKSTTIVNPDGKFVFTDLPARAFRVSVIEHSNPVIYTYLQNQGGQEVDLRDVPADTVDFIYTAPPNVEIEDFVTNDCGYQLLPSGINTKTKIRVFENYTGGKCYLNNANLTFSNEIAGKPDTTVSMISDIFTYEYKPKEPNLISPYTKTLTITAEVNGSLSVGTIRGIVLGQRARTNTFTTRDPEIPDFILRDPPGDGSFATWEKGTTHCTEKNRTVINQLTEEAYVAHKFGTEVLITTLAGPAMQFKNHVTPKITGGSDQTWTNNTSETECLTTTESISTSANDGIVGSAVGGDVYIGSAKNVIYGIVDELNYDPGSCMITRTEKLTIFGENLATTFIYSEHQIVNDVIPSLFSLGTKKDSTSAKLWKDIIKLNKDDYYTGDLIENVSFDAGATRDKAIQSDNNDATSFEFQSHGFVEAAVDAGVDINGFGLDFGVKIKYDHSKANDEITTNENTKTVSYHLEDDDQNDNFNVEIRKGKKWDSPTFKLVAGETMCPWEPGTVNREQVGISLDKTAAVNVSANTPAVFSVTLRNLSQTGQTMNYRIADVPGTNPDGAIINIVGASFERDIQLAGFESKRFTMTVDRGPLEFDYLNLKIAGYSECQYQRSLGLGDDPKTIDVKTGDYQASELFYKEISFNVNFVEPCSPVDIGFPLQDFVVTPASDNKLSVTLSEYDEEDDDLKLIRLQYRPIGGDGSWININQTLKADLGDAFTLKEWNTALLKDGAYEIRAVAECFDVNLSPGISTVVKGSLERLPPELVGEPQPSDGTWDPGDEISITFNEPIDCDKVVQADILANNTIGLYDATTNALVDATISCVGNKITIVPNINPVFFENRAFRVIVSGKDYDDAKLLENPNHQAAAIRDKAGNMIPTTIKWEFFVNQNNLEWVGTDVIEVAEIFNPVTVTRQIRNRGGTIVNFRMENIPSWLTVVPKTGALNPGQLADVTLSFQEDLLIGDYANILQLVGSKGEEPLGIDYRVRCPAPKWAVDNPSQYAGSMNMVARLNIFGIESADPSDIIVARIDGQIRGVGNIRYYRQLDTDVLGSGWLAFITIFGNAADDGKEILYNVWDGDKCLEFAEVIERFRFEDGEFIGSPVSPQTIHVINRVQKCIPLNKGWNWISINLDLGDNSVTNVLSSLKHKQNAIIKDNEKFSRYYVENNLGWQNTLKTIQPEKRYMLYLEQSDTLCIKGMPYESATRPINIVTGWNWIGVIPQVGQSVTQALSGLTPLNGDIIKDQTRFAQFVAGIGWVGNLNFLEAPKGYLLKISNPGILRYASNNVFLNGEIQLNNLNLILDPPLEFAQSQYQSTMTIIAKVTGVKIDPNDELRAYIKGVAKGVVVGQFVESLSENLFFLTTYHNDPEQVTFKLFKASANKELPLTGTVSYLGDGSIGLVEDPLVLSLESNLVSSVVLEIDDQIIYVPTKVFENIDVSLAHSKDIECTSYSYNIILPMGTETSPPACEPISGQQNNMTGVARVKYNELTSFVALGDMMTFVNPATQEVVGCADAQQVGAEFLFSFTVVGGNSIDSIPIDVHYYSSTLDFTFLLRHGVFYKKDRELGSIILPIELNFAPIVITMVGSSTLEINLVDTSWVGEYCIEVFANTCEDGLIEGFEDGQTTVCFSRWDLDDCGQLVIRTGVEDKTFIRAENINSEAVINANKNVQYVAGQTVELLPGFEVLSLGSLQIKILPCPIE